MLCIQKEKELLEESLGQFKEVLKLMKCEEYDIKGDN